MTEVKLRSARQEIGHIAIDDYTHKIPKTFFCVQCGKLHKVSDNGHYYNSYCHRFGGKQS